MDFECANSPADWHRGQTPTWPASRVVLMALLFVIGVMNMLWIAGAAILVSPGERQPRPC
ncbi:hypothetical protein [Mesorhizobium sp. B2-4-15]|uniref:hypothetical protein n=1 Tax=Mesorhizobium sp. B2-4-15 TaxID=2589934 RepID=UPI0015EF7175|nr:hypothetical protein [Mesorhizobium sp. B2-4-15]